VQWWNTNHLISIDNSGKSSNPLTDLVLPDTHPQYTNTNIVSTICMILSPHLLLSDTHTQSAHKHKYYYYNLHNFITIPCPVWHTVSTQTKLLLLQSTQIFFARFCPVWHTQSKHKHKFITKIYTTFFLLYTLIFLGFFFFEWILSLCPFTSNDFIYRNSLQGHQICSSLT